jgi:predicted DNA-binding protein
MEKLIAKAISQQLEQLKDNRTKDYKVSFDIKGEFTAKKGEDFEQIISFAVPYDKLLKLALSKLNGVTLSHLVKESLETEIDTKDFKVKVSNALAEIKGKSKKLCSGKLTTANIILTDTNIDVCEYC